MPLPARTRPVALLALAAVVCGCDPVYQRAVTFDAREHAGPVPTDGQVLAAVDDVARTWGFAMAAPESPPGPPRGGGEVLREYRLRYTPDERRDKRNTLILSAVRRPSAGTIDVRLVEAITDRESPKFREVFNDLRRRLPPG